MLKYPHIFEPIELAGTIFRNRIFAAPTGWMDKYQDGTLPPEAAAPFLLGLCGGYPAGAEAVAGLVRDGTLRPEEGARLLPVCNNTGPGFIVGVAGAAVFGFYGGGDITPHGEYDIIRTNLLCDCPVV